MNMSFVFENLNAKTREYMMNELEYDIQRDRVYLSKRFNETGEGMYCDLFRQAIATGDSQSLANALTINNCFRSTEERKNKNGVIQAKIPSNAPLVLAENEFNRFYMRALAIQAIETNSELEIYRARFSENPRTESELLIGKIIDPKKLLEDLRENIGIDTLLGLPPGPNSGLSTRLITP